METKNTALIIFGASGDLAQRKLIPALQILHHKGVIDNSNIIIGSGRTAFSDEEFRSHFKNLPPEFAANLHYHQYIPGLKAKLASLGDFKRLIFFFSLPPAVYGETAKALVEEGFGEESSIIIEKPFGTDYRSAVALNRELACYFDESRIYRIDHYLAKEAVQNLLVFRFANSIFEPLWNSRYIEYIEINAFETLALENRAAYFDTSGSMRDMVQNHLMQLLCLTTMEPPISLDAEDIQYAKLSILRTMKIEESYRFQYEGYTSEKGVHSESNTDTYCELKASINNFRWKGTPIYIRTGKAVSRKGSEIGVKFRSLPRLLFNTNGGIPANQIRFQIQPTESITLDLNSKIPGSDKKMKTTHMNFFYHEAFDEPIPEAYQKLLADVLMGDKTLFVSAHETEASWKLLAPHLDQGDVTLYKRGKMPKSHFKVNWIDFEKGTTEATII